MMRINKINIIFFLIILFGVISCTSNKQIADFKNTPVTNGIYVGKSGFSIIKICYKPLSKSDISEGLENFEYFKLSLTWNGKPFIQRNVSDNIKYNDDVTYLSDGILKDIYIVKQNGDTIKPVSCITGYTYGMTPEDEILIAFDKTSLIHNENILFIANGTQHGYGYHKTIFNLSELKEINI